MIVAECILLPCSEMNGLISCFPDTGVGLISPGLSLSFMLVGWLSTSAEMVKGIGNIKINPTDSSGSVRKWKKTLDIYV